MAIARLLKQFVSLMANSTTTYLVNNDAFNDAFEILVLSGLNSSMN